VVASTRRRPAWHARLLFRVREAALANEALEQGQRGGRRGKQGMVRRLRLPGSARMRRGGGGCRTGSFDMRETAEYRNPSNPRLQYNQT
jgi:hypothetical protein